MRKIEFLFLLFSSIAVAQNTSGPGYPPSSLACNAGLKTQIYKDTTNNLVYTCVNNPNAGYIWQLSQSPILPVTNAPSGSCTAGIPNEQVTTTGVQYSCQNGTWGAIGSGSGGISPVAPAGAQFIFKGDSLTLGNGLTSATQSYPAKFGNCTLSGSPLKCTATSGLSFAGTSATVVNLGVSGETVATALSNYTTEVHPYCIQATPTVPVFLHFEEGINDLAANVSAATLFANIQSYWALAVADGCTVIASTITPALETSAQEANRQTVNSSIRAAIGKYSFLDDLDKFLPNNVDTVWYQSDRVHYTAAAASKVADNINGVLSGKFAFQPVEKTPTISGAGTATFAAGAAAGSSPGTPVCYTGHICDSVSGFVDFTLGSGTTTGVVLSITLGGVTRASIPNCLGFAEVASTGVGYLVVPGGASDSNTFAIYTSEALPASTEMVFTYFCGGY